LIELASHGAFWVLKTIKKKKKESNEEYFSAVLSHIRKSSIVLFEGSSPACPCDNSSVKIMMSIKQWCEDNDGKNDDSVHHKSHMDWPRIKPRPPP
jgi:hypothetical protein